MKLRGSFIALILLIVMGGVVLSTRRDFDRRNARIFTAMVDSPAYAAQSTNAVFSDGITQRAPIAGTIPRDFQAYPYADTPEDRQRSKRKFKNPYRSTEAVLVQGREVYENFCAHCHGHRGFGDGPVAQRSILSMSIVGKMSRDRRDGELFHIISHGWLNMPPHASLISQDDRWKLIRYVRELQKAQLPAPEGKTR